MTRLFRVSILMALAVALALAQTAAPAPAETPVANLVAGGISYLPGGSPSIAGTGLYARLVSGSTNTFAFTVIDALPATVKPFTVTSQVSVGVAQKILQIGKVPIFVPTAAGPSWNGTNVGWAWSTGGLASIAPKPGSGFRLMPALRVTKSSVSGGAGYGLIAGMYFGWGF